MKKKKEEESTKKKKKKRKKWRITTKTNLNEPKVLLCMKNNKQEVKKKI